MMHLDANLKVLVMDTDYYALQAINSYLAWDRRTRVTHLSESLADMWSHIAETSPAELPDVIILDAGHVGGAGRLHDIITALLRRLPQVSVICLLQTPDLALIEAAAEAGARGALLKHEVRMQIAWAVVYALDHDFVITDGVRRAAGRLFNTRIFHAKTLPRRREFNDLTERVRQAIELCVVEGLPAHIAADEMGISLHTIRGYIKEGYRILEMYDDADYPVDMTPQERAFMRFTSFHED